MATWTKEVHGELDPDKFDGIQCSQLKITEDKKYQKHLVRKEPVRDGFETSIMGLYRCVFRLPDKKQVRGATFEVFALAPSPEDAAHQATAQLDWSDWIENRKLETSEVMNWLECVERVPFVIRGWSGELF